MSGENEVIADMQQDGAADMIANNNEVDESADVIGELTKDMASRPMRKAKRHLGRLSPGKEGAPEASNAETKKILPLSKNSRKSRDGKGRGLPKKGGAGGKGVWGKLGEEVNEDGKCQDSHDPNYDSDSQDEYTIEEIDPEVTAAELLEVLEPAILEYYENNNSEEFVKTLEDLNIGDKRPKLVEFLISKAIDHKAVHCEMTSVLLSDLYSRVLHHNHFMEGFDDILGKLTDLVLDAPHAPEVVGKFIARAVADDCLPPKYIQGYKGQVDCEMKQAALFKADTLLNQKHHGIVRLDNIWGTGGGIRPVKSLIKKIIMLLKEYLSSGDIAEATRCLVDLQVPHFHHELVYESVYIALEKSTDRAQGMMVKFLKSLAASIVITPDQITQGFQRIFNNIADICLDIPNAYILLESFALDCHKQGIIDDKVFKDVPQRGRKRFVSEGDGGLIKDS